jgi:lysine 2,3-aminomutase
MFDKVSLLRRIRKENPVLCQELRSASTLDEARTVAFSWLSEREGDVLFETAEGLNAADRGLTLQAVAVARSVFSPRGESLSGNSSLSTLKHLLGGDSDAGEAGFLAEMLCLFRQCRNESGYGDGWLGENLPELTRLAGRKGAQRRGRFLDQLFESVATFLDRIPTGLDPDLQSERADNRGRISRHLGATEADWNDWRWQVKHVFKGPQGLRDLQALVPLSDEDVQSIQLCLRHKIPFGITPHYLSLFDFGTAKRTRDLAVRAQVLPPLNYARGMAEARRSSPHKLDFMGETDTSPVDLVTRRYPSNLILKPCNTCPQICVYCQRNWEIDEPLAEGYLASEEELEAAFSYIGGVKALSEVLVTGGDPLLMSDRRVKLLTDRLASLPQLSLVRWATRTLVTMPQRFTPELVDLLASRIRPGVRDVYVVTHFQHATEVTLEVVRAMELLRSRGISVYNQQVFTAQVSGRFEASALRVALKKTGIDPYYLFYPKGKPETEDYQVPLARLLQERKEEARLLPGQFRTDEPVFNVPRLGKNHVRASQDRELLSFLPDGRRVYLFYPWEKGIARSKSYVHVDRSIRSYLEYRASLGDNPGAMETIWYYY